MSLLMDALRKAEVANKATPPSGQEADVASTAPSQVAEQPASSPTFLLDAQDLTSEAKDATTLPLEAPEATLALEPMPTASGDVPADGTLEQAEEVASGLDAAPHNELATTEQVIPEPPIVTELAAAAAVNTGEMQNDILYEFDEEFAALVRRLEEEEKTNPTSPVTKPVAAPTKPQAAVGKATATVTVKPSPTLQSPPHKSDLDTTATRAAAGIFSARAKLLGNRTMKLALLSLGMVIIFLSGGAYYVYTESTRLSQPMATMPPPLQVENDTEANESPEPVLDANVVATGEAGIDSITANNSTLTLLAEANTIIDAASKPSAVIPHPMLAAPLKSQASIEKKTPVTAPIPRADIDSELPPAVEKTVLKPPAQVASSTEAHGNEVTVNQVNVKRDTQTPSHYQQAFITAFQAYQSGNIGAAAAAYEQALQLEPMSRDAMLGLAATSMRLGQTQRARELYEQILRVAPNDAQAAAGFMNLLSESEPLRAESEIKFLLRQLPNVADLHFALGNVYIKQQKWGEAQKSFSAASRLDPINADYVFNLAVSFDQMGMRQRALDQYILAQQLAAKQRAGFDPVAVNARIQELSAPPTEAEGS